MVNFPDDFNARACDASQASASAEEVEREELRRWLTVLRSSTTLELAKHLRAQDYNTLDSGIALSNLDAYMEDFVERVMEGI